MGAEHHIHKRGAADNVFALLAGHAAANGDQGGGVFLLHLADSPQVGKNLFLRLVADRAGVEEDDFSFFRIFQGNGAGAVAEQVRDFGRIVFIHLASEGAD